MMPEFMLKRMILANFPTKVLEAEIAASVDFMVTQVFHFKLHCFVEHCKLETLTQPELASRLTLNCSVYENLKPAELPFDKTKITILDVTLFISIHLIH